MEEFRDIKGFEGLYQVSNLGRVRSLGNGKERMLKPREHSNGYLFVSLYKDGKGKHYSVHRLVAEAFIPNPDNLPEVNHIDEDKTNNRVWNLEWCTRKYNCNYGTRNERTSKRVYQYTLDSSFVQSYPSVAEAERRTGIANQSISNCCNGRPKRKSAGGYRWSFNPPTPDTCCVLW